MDRLIEVPAWAMFWLIFIGILAGLLIGPWLDSILERRDKDKKGGQEC